METQEQQVERKKNMARRKSLAKKKRNTGRESTHDEPGALAVGLEMLKYGIDPKTVGDYIQSKTSK